MSQRFHSKGCAYAARWRTGSTTGTLSTADASYLAGLIDGEGSIFLYRKRNGAALRVTITNTVREVLAWTATATGVGSIVVRKGNAKHKTSYFWQVNAQAAESLIVQVQPYLRIKAEQATLALDFQRRLRIPSDKADKVWQRHYLRRMQVLNQRGPNDLKAS